MTFEKAIMAVLRGEKISRGKNGIPIAYDLEKQQICYLYSVPTGGSKFGSEVVFSNVERVADDWIILSNPLDDYTGEQTTRSLNPKAVKVTEEMLKDIPLEAGKAYEYVKAEKTMESAERIEITFKSGETIAYNSGEWDDYAYDGKAVIVKRNGAWIGIYNFADVFCVELK